MRFTPLGDNALMLEVGDVIDEPTHRRVQEAWRVLAAAPLPGVIELVPAYTTVALFYDPLLAVQAGAPEDDIFEWLVARAKERLKNPPKMEKAKSRTVDIPVCYGGEFGPDLGLVAKQAKLSPEEVVKRHTKPEYLVYLVGFAPGFPYLGGYPLATPGGWNLIGRTPEKIFRPAEHPPVLLRAGDRVKFRAITAEEFAKWEAKP